MFLPDNVPIICNLPKDIEFADIYFLHDIHFGSELFDERKWKALKSKIQSEETAFVCWIGDLMENAIPNSKSDMFSQKYSPAEQKEWAAQELFDLRKKTLAVVAGNHEHNRTTKICGLFPMYDVCLIAGGDACNYEKAKKITHDLQVRDLANCYICPLLNFSHLEYGEIGFDAEMELCLDILSECEKLIVASEIGDSKGVQMEIDFANLVGMEVEWLEDTE